MADVSTRSSICQVGYEARKLPRALLKGTKGIVACGTEFTPQYDGEDDESYKDRLKGATLYNGFEDAIKKSTGKVLSKDVVVGDDVPATIAEYMNNVDGQGRNLTAFALDAFREALTDGLSFIFVDFPRVVSKDGKQPFLSDQLAQGARPNAILYTADQIIGFKHQNVGGTEILTQLRISETVVEADGEWGEKKVDQVKVFRVLFGEQPITTFEVWRKSTVENSVKDEWVLFDSGIISLKYIPIVPVYTNRTGYFTGLPPFATLAELNLEHWISSTDQRKALMYARFAMMVFSGIPKGSITKVGPAEIICMTEPDAKWGKVETSGEGITAGRLDLEAIEKRMQTAGMTIQIQTSNARVTATAADINSDEGNAALFAAAGALEDSLDQMLQIFADYLALGNGGHVDVNKDFGKKRSTATVADFVSLYNAGLLDEKSILSELQMRGDISEDLDIEAVLTAIKENPPNLLGGSDPLNLGGQ